MAGKELVTVRFLRSQSPYAEGELAGFFPETAKLLVQDQVAEYYHPQQPSDKGNLEETVRTSELRTSDAPSQGQGQDGDVVTRRPGGGGGGKGNKGRKKGS